MHNQSLSSKLVSVAIALLVVIKLIPVAIAEQLPVIEVEGQPLARNASRLSQALRLLGSPLPDETSTLLDQAARERKADRLQNLLDPLVLLAVSINPESRVKVTRGPAKAEIQQAGFTPVLIKIVNESTGTQRLKMISPQAGPVYAGVSQLSMRRQQQEQLRENQNEARSKDRFLAVELYSKPPMTDRLSGLGVEYAVALIYSSEAGLREATIGFDIGQGNQDLGLRGETPVLFRIRPAIPVQLTITDVDGRPTTGRLLFRDELGHVFPPQAKRLAPDLFFQPHVYRQSGEYVNLPPGRFRVRYSRGPEYRVLEKQFNVPRKGPFSLALKLQRWVRPAEHGFFSGDHHIHAAGCAHYTVPTQGVTPADMFRQVKGEGLNVGCVLTWGPCYDHQRRFFSPAAHTLSEPRTVLKYDLEISGFGSQSLGHVCLLNLQDQTYPGSDGTATRGWPTWTTPVMRWAKEQGGFAGYAHSASGLAIDPQAASGRLLQQADSDRDGQLTHTETLNHLLPEEFADIDEDANGRLTRRELQQSLNRVADQLPNLAIPEMNGVGAMEICVSAAEGVCDFISAMDTARIQEWNTWYHLLNCGMPVKVSGETDFPCMSSRRVGQGRVYVKLGDREVVDYGQWCSAMASGRSYVSDGFAHALSFDVEGIAPGEGEVAVDKPAKVRVTAQVCFALETPAGVAYGNVAPERGRRVVGDTVLLHGERTEVRQAGGNRLVEIVVNGQTMYSEEVPADGEVHLIETELSIERSSWVALRNFPQLHTNPVNVIVAENPIRASQDSALWCVGMTEQLWRNRENRISEAERDAAKAAFERALTMYRQIAQEAAGP